MNENLNLAPVSFIQFHEMERAAQVALLRDAVLLYLSAPPEDQPKRIADENSGNHKVYRVSVSAVQKYLDEIGNIADQYLQSFPSDLLPVFKADLRLLEVCSDLNVTHEENIPYEIEARCPINLYNTKCKIPIKLVISSGASSIDLSFATFEKRFEVQIKNDIHLDVVADAANFNDELILSRDKKATQASMAISANASEIKKFSGFDITITNAMFKRTTFKDKALFQNFKFQWDAKFINSKFAAGAIFFECSFSKAPDFHGAELHQDTAFQKCKFDVSKSVIDDVASFRVLKAHFAKMRDSKHELMFYALEQRTERETSENVFLVSLVSRLYDEISEYGASIDRAVKFFILWNIIFLMIFHLAIILQNDQLIEIKNKTLNAYPELFLTLQNTFNPLALFSEKQLVVVNSITIYVISLFQSLGSIIVLALMLLAIRGRFRKGSGSEN